MKLNNYRVKLLEATSLEDLQTQLDEFLAARGAFADESPEREAIDVGDLQLEYDGSDMHYAIRVLYTE